jgi:hypothetical protein
MISRLTAGQTYHLTFDWPATQYQFVNGAGAPFNCPDCWTGATTNEIDVSLGGVTQRTSNENVGVGRLHRLDDGILRLHGDIGIGTPELRFGRNPTGRSSGCAPRRRLADRRCPRRSCARDLGDDGLGFAGLGLIGYRRRRRVLAIG